MLISNICKHNILLILLRTLFSTNKTDNLSSHRKTNSTALILPSLQDTVMRKINNLISSWNNSQINIHKISKSSCSNQINNFSFTQPNKINNNQSNTICSEAVYLLRINWKYSSLDLIPLFFFTISLSFFCLHLSSPISFSKLFILITLFLLAPFSDMNL